MKIALDAIKQLRTKSQTLQRLADVLERLNGLADDTRPKRRRMSRAGRLKISQAQKKRWAKRRA